MIVDYSSTRASFTPTSIILTLPKHLRLAVQLNPTIPPPYFVLCLLYWMQNREPELKATLQSLAQISPPQAQQLHFQLQALQTQALGSGISRQAVLEAHWLNSLQVQAQPNQAQSWLTTQRAPTLHIRSPDCSVPRGKNSWARQEYLRLIASKLIRSIY